MIKKIVDAVTIPVMAKARIGHFVEAQVYPILMYLHSLLMRVSDENRSYKLSA